MATNVTFQLRRGLSTQWTSAGTTLAAGEPGVETDTGKFKLGDGVRSWNNLPYFVPQVLLQAGATGVQGLQGVTGSGSTGPQGVTGIPGTAGVTGPQGLPGITGIPGTAGSTGAQGITGIPGTAGATGAQGITGIPGTAGATGAQGPTGNGFNLAIVGGTGITLSNTGSTLTISTLPSSMFFIAPSFYYDPFYLSFTSPVGNSNYILTGTTFTFTTGLSYLITGTALLESYGTSGASGPVSVGLNVSTAGPVSPVGSTGTYYSTTPGFVLGYLSTPIYYSNLVTVNETYYFTFSYMFTADVNSSTLGFSLFNYFPNPSTNNINFRLSINSLAVKTL